MDANSARRHFLALNEERLRRVRMDLGGEREPLVDLLPLIFHQNDRHLPGFLEDGDVEPAAGFPSFQPGRIAVEEAKRLVKEARGPEYRPGARRTFDLHAAIAVTNLGQLSRADEATVDLWLITTAPNTGGDGPKDDPAPRDALMEKAQVVSTWYAEREIDLRVHLVSDQALRAGRTGRCTGRCGYQNWPKLLLDTLYTQGIWLGGRMPAWWFLPPGLNQGQGHIAELVGEGVLAEHETVDLGAVEPIPPDELFRAATEWMFSGVDHPYEMLPKILLSEAYAGAKPGFLPLSATFKEALYGGETNISRLDPLVLTYQLVTRHLSGEESDDRIDALRRACYIQSGIDLTTDGEGEPLREEWRRDAMKELTKHWGWNPARFHDLNQRDDWKLERVVEERQFLVGVLSHCYKVLSAFGRAHGERVREALERFSLLRHKLYAAFERKGGKIELLNFDPEALIAESHLLINQLGSGEGATANPFATTQVMAAPLLLAQGANAAGSGYTLHRGDIKHLDPEPLKRSACFIELLAWIHFNRLYDPRTLFALNPPEGMVEQRELRNLTEGFQELAPGGKLPEAGIEAFSRPAVVERAALFINTGRIDPLTRRTRKGIHLSSDNIDIFSYGSRNETLAESFDLVVVTSRREVLTFRYRGDEALPECLRDYLSWFPEGKGKPPQIRVHCYSSERGSLFARRFEELFQHLSSALYEESEPRYVLRFQRAFFLFRFIEGRAQYQRAESYEGVLSQLAAPAREFSTTSGNPWALVGTPLPYILKLNRRGVVQFFFQALGSMAGVYLLDERGSLFHQIMAFDNPDALLSHFHRFFDAVLPRRGLHGEGANEQVEYYRITKAKSGQYGLSPVSMEVNGGRRYFQVQVIAEALEDKRNQLTVYLNDEEFSSLEHGDQLFNVVAGHILSKRKSGERYPIYITDIDITRLLTGSMTEGGVQTIHFLTYKKRIEDRLNEALRKL